MTSPATVLIIGSLAVKLEETLYLRSQIIALSSNTCKVKILDISHNGKPTLADSNLPESEVITALPESTESLSKDSRTDLINHVVTICVPIVEKLIVNGSIHGIVAAGSATISALAAAVMRNACPIGFPKLLVSTLASGDLKPYIEHTDITIMYSLVDIEGLNSLVKTLLSNAAGAIAGMAIAHASLQKQMGELNMGSGKKIAITSLGDASPAVSKIRRILTSTPHDASDFEVFAFHATGAGGQAMERLIDEGKVDVVVDLTTTEIADELCGGVHSAGPDRLEAATKKGIPLIVSVGGCDTVNFGPRYSVPASLRGRNLSYHTPNITLMRTNKDENIKIGKFITSKLKNHATDPKRIRVLLPKGGLSTLDRANVEKPTTSSAAPEAQTQPESSSPVKGTTGEPWHDAAANTALFETVMGDLTGSGIEVFEYQDNINDDAFAISVCEHLLELMGDDPRKYRLANARRRKWSFDHGASITRLMRRNSIEIPDAV